MISVFWIPEFPVELSCKKECISPERRRFQETLAGDKRRCLFAAADHMTVQLVQQVYGIPSPILSGKEKPMIVQDPLISVSRSYGGRGLTVALNRGCPVGVDAEKIQPADPSVMRCFFTEKESAFIKRAAYRDRAYTQIWTRKESYMKCTGTGLSGPWNLIDVWDDRSVSHPDGEKSFFFRTYQCFGQVVSLCSPEADQFPSNIIKWSLKA